MWRRAWQRMDLGAKDAEGLAADKKVRSFLPMTLHCVSTAVTEEGNNFILVSEFVLRQPMHLAVRIIVAFLMAANASKPFPT